MFIIGLQIVCSINGSIVAFQYTLVTGVLSIIYVFFVGKRDLWTCVIKIFSLSQTLRRV